MDVIIMPTADKAAKLAAKIIADAVKAKPAYNLGLATGRTMERLYAYLADWHKNEGLDFSLCKSFNLDEYVGFDGSNKDSYRYYMNFHLFDKINIDKRNTYVPNGVADDLEAAAAEYEATMESCGGVDMQLLGIGRTGHIGFNEPLSSFSSRTRAVTLTKTTYEQNSPLFDKPEDMPMRAEQNMLFYKTVLAFKKDADIVYTQLTGGHCHGSEKKDEDGQYAFVKTAFAWLKEKGL